MVLEHSCAQESDYSFGPLKALFEGCGSIWAICLVINFHNCTESPFELPGLPHFFFFEFPILSGDQAPLIFTTWLWKNWTLLWVKHQLPGSWGIWHTQDMLRCNCPFQTLPHCPFCLLQARYNTCCELHLVSKFQKFPWPLLTHPNPRTKGKGVFWASLSALTPPPRVGVLDLWSQAQYWHICIFYNTPNLPPLLTLPYHQRDCLCQDCPSRSPGWRIKSL